MPRIAKTTTAKKKVLKTTPTKSAATKNTAAKKKTTKKVATKKTAAKAVAKMQKRKIKAPVEINIIPTIIPPASTLVTTKNIYLNNKELFQEIKAAKKQGQMTGRLAKMLQLLCTKYAKKGNFINYTYNEDMQAYAMMMLVRTWNSFNPEKSDNPFAFFTQCIKNSFIQYLNQEKRQRNIRDLILIDQGMNPSFGFEGTDHHVVDDEEDFHTMQDIFKGIKDLPAVNDDDLPTMEGVVATESQENVPAAQAAV